MTIQEVVDDARPGTVTELASVSTSLRPFIQPQDLVSAVELTPSVAKLQLHWTAVPQYLRTLCSSEVDDLVRTSLIVESKQPLPELLNPAEISEYRQRMLEVGTRALVKVLNGDLGNVNASTATLADRPQLRMAIVRKQ